MVFAYVVIVPIGFAVVATIYRYTDRRLSMFMMARNTWLYLNDESEEDHSGSGSDGEEDEAAPRDNNYSTVVSNTEAGDEPERDSLLQEHERV